MSSARLTELFEPLPLPRWRAILALTCAAGALLSFGGALSYASGSPDIHGPSAPRYWAAFFAFYTVAFGGAAVFGAFPRLARASFKGGWLLLTALVGAATLAIRFGVSGWPVSGDEWWSVLRLYAPALAAVFLGICWGNVSVEEEGAGGSGLGTRGSSL